MALCNGGVIETSRYQEKETPNEDCPSVKLISSDALKLKPEATADTGNQGQSVGLKRKHPEEALTEDLDKRSNCRGETQDDTTVKRKKTGE